jgi:hypothetical protein
MAGRSVGARRLPQPQRSARVHSQSDVIRGGRIELVDVVAIGDKVVVTMQPPSDAGEPLPPVANLTTFREGKVVEMVHYPDALAAARASAEPPPVPWSRDTYGDTTRAPIGPDPWRGRQPNYESLICRRSSRFALATKLPSGVAIRVPLGRVRLDSR